jgi:peptidoglycan/LPS O-acetylase OafA/YrhL
VHKNISPLTSLRFVAAILVLFHHSVPVFLPGVSAWGVQPGPQEYVGDVALAFRISASFFFLLSGYVLSLAYLNRERAVDRRRFFAARFARLYPLYLVVVVLDARKLFAAEIKGHGLIGLTKTAGIFIANAAALQGWYPAKLLRIDLPSWSLSAEILFCVCFPWLGALLWRLRGVRLWMTALGLYAGGQALVWGMRPHVKPDTLTYFPLFHASTFALGILLARWRSLEEKREGQSGARPWQANLVLGLSIGGIILCVPLEPLFHVASPYQDGLLAPMFAGLIWALSAASSPLSRWLCAKWLLALGNASYALYLIHFPILNLFQRFQWATGLFYPAYIALCVGLSLLSFRFFETPARLWLTDWFRAHWLSNTEGRAAADHPRGLQPQGRCS